MSQQASCFFAADLGASSGRTALVHLDTDGRLTLQETHRFPNGPLERDGGLYWDGPRLLVEIKRGLARAARQVERIDGIAVDTWGVDYALLDGVGALIDLPRHYRDPCTQGVMERLCERVGAEHLYKRTGIQFLPFNTIYQLAAERRAHLARARRLLFMPDLMNHWLCGARTTEATIASTSQLYDAQAGAWADELIAEIGVAPELLPEVLAPATVLAPLKSEIAAEVGLKHQPPVIAGAGHDTACAVAAVPARGDDWAYISSGTWSLIGIELDAPRCITAALADGFTNEAGVAGTVRFLRNVAGLWLLEECRRTWQEEGEAVSYDELLQEARQSPPLRTSLDPDAAAFLAPGDMPRRIAEWCAEHGEPVPRTRGEYARAILESLALRYQSVLQRLEGHRGRPIEVLHIVGGGSRNSLLNQFTADACGIPVRAGPTEATTIGCALTQALALGRLASLGELRAVVRRSVELERFEPGESGPWRAAAERLAVV